jgi:hypothetical protein
MQRMKILVCESDDDAPYLDGTERKIFFLTPRGFRVRTLPENVRDLFSRFDFVCADHQGAHFGRGIVRDGVTVADALAVLSTYNGLLILPPHHSREPVSQKLVEALERCAPDFAVIPGDTSRQVIEKANTARGFAPFVLTQM